MLNVGGTMLQSGVPDEQKVGSKLSTSICLSLLGWIKSDQYSRHDGRYPKTVSPNNYFFKLLLSVSLSQGKGHTRRQALLGHCSLRLHL